MSDANRTKWRAAKNILCVRLDAIGDVLMTAPAVRAVKGEDAAARRVTLLTSKSGAVGARLIPEIDEIIEYESPWMKAGGGESESAARDLAMIENVRARKFDAAVIFSVYSQNPLPAALLCFLAQIPLRLAHCRENPYRLLTDWIREIEPEKTIRHEVRRQLDLVSAVGFDARGDRMRVAVSAAAKRRVAGILRDFGIESDSRSWLVVHAGATAASRRYPPRKFARAAAMLARDHGLRVVFTGSQAETALVEEIRRAAEAETISLSGRLSFEELAALIGFAPVLISNNSSPVHLASACGTPVVDLYALTNPQHTPWRVPHSVLFADVPCRFCYKSVCPAGHHECLEKVEPERVVRATLELLRAAPTLPEPNSETFAPTRSFEEERTGRADVAAASPLALFASKKIKLC
jgi:lipopolysaccharide heptosyltransferase II